ncbi:Phosphatidylinositol 3,4,5-trisphosphate-dependent Rac exchanger 2 protein [Tilletia horrida]|nr:Phosphatidylinositol 3,4,5-trisphosphate-dependent Rac exchanger 2 protein [Tilletia horrida]
MAFVRPHPAASGPSVTPAPFVSSPIPPPPHKGPKMDVRDGALGKIMGRNVIFDSKSLTEKDRILEIACIITDGELVPVDSGVQYVIQTEKKYLDAMGPCVAKPHDHVRAAILCYVYDRVPNVKQACLAGNTVHADKVFLEREFPELIEHLSYRIVDVSSIKELAARWYGKAAIPMKKSEHRALSDIKGSIEELKHYRKTIFRNQGNMR